MVDRPQRATHVGVGRGGEEIGRRRGHAALARRDGHALTRVEDGVGQQLAPRDGRLHHVAAVGVRRRPSGHGARHRERGHAAADGDGGPEAREVPLAIDRGGGAAGGVESAQLPARGVVDQPHVVAADPVHVRVHDGDRRGGGDRGVQRVAALPHHRDTPASEASTWGVATRPRERARLGPARWRRHAAYPTTPRDRRS